MVAAAAAEALAGCATLLHDSSRYARDGEAGACAAASTANTPTAATAAGAPASAALLLGGARLVQPRSGATALRAALHLHGVENGALNAVVQRCAVSVVIDLQLMSGGR